MRVHFGKEYHCKDGKLLKHVMNDKLFMCTECGKEVIIEQHWYGSKVQERPSTLNTSKD